MKKFSLKSKLIVATMLVMGVAAFMSEKKVETTTQKIIKFLNKDIF